LITLLHTRIRQLTGSALARTPLSSRLILAAASLCTGFDERKIRKQMSGKMWPVFATRAGSPRLLAYTSSCAKLRQWQAIRPTLLALSCNSVLVHVLLQQLDMLYLIAFDGYMGYCIGHFRRHIWCNLFANVPLKCFLQSVQRTLHDICHHYIISQNS